MKNSGNTYDSLESSDTPAFLKELKLAKREELPLDVLDLIYKKLDFDDLFQFYGVCKSWRTFHKSNFLSSQEPLLVRNLIRKSTTESYSFITIPNKKDYDLKIMSCFPSPDFTYVRASSNYFIMVHNDNSFHLFNPFTRMKKVINTSFRVKSSCSEHERYHALLAFEKTSDDEEFVLLVLCPKSRSLHVYQSRHYRWATYYTLKSEVVVDFVVFNNIIYVVTNNANIGVLNLNSGNIQFLNLKNTPKNIPSRHFWLVNCDDQLLFLDLLRRDAYKIDLSIMNYVKMKSLGDIALFYVSYKHCQALSNPKRFGYESNYVYEVNILNHSTRYHWNNGITSKIYTPPRSKRDFDFFDWCFRHLKYQVDYSLVE